MIRHATHEYSVAASIAPLPLPFQKCLLYEKQALLPNSVYGLLYPLVVGYYYHKLVEC